MCFESQIVQKKSPVAPPTDRCYWRVHHASQSSGRADWASPVNTAGGAGRRRELEGRLSARGRGKG